jgi:hypothetical protein
MSAKNITTEKMDSSGFQTGGYKAPGGMGGKTTPKSAIIDDRDTGDSAFPKGKVGAGKENKNTSAYKG